jgi:hypothetical protein
MDKWVYCEDMKKFGEMSYIKKRGGEGARG